MKCLFLLITIILLSIFLYVEKTVITFRISIFKFCVKNFYILAMRWLSNSSEEFKLIISIK